MAHQCGKRLGRSTSSGFGGASARWELDGRGRTGGLVGVHTHSRARVNIQRNSLCTTHGQDGECVPLAELMYCQ